MTEHDHELCKKLIEELVTCLINNSMNQVIEGPAWLLDWISKYVVDRGAEYTEGLITVYRRILDDL